MCGSYLSRFVGLPLDWLICIISVSQDKGIGLVPSISTWLWGNQGDPEHENPIKEEAGVWIQINQGERINL